MATDAYGRFAPAYDTLAEPAARSLSGSARRTLCEVEYSRHSCTAYPLAARRAVTGSSRDMLSARSRGVVVTDRISTYRDGSHVGRANVRERSWYESDAWRFER